MTATPAERRALAFFAAVACLGVGVRAAGAVRREPPKAEQRAALARQIDAVDSARRSARAKGKGGGGTSGGRSGAGATGGDAGLTIVGARRGGRHARPDFVVSSPRRSTPNPSFAAPATIDVDVATAAELEALPGVGPALARRIIADRDSLGPFGSAAGLERVRGIGPGLVKKLQDRVTFSGTPRLSHAVATAPSMGRPPPSQATATSPPERPRRSRRRR